MEGFKDFEILHSKKLYLPTDDSIMKVQFECMELMYDYNSTRPHEQARRAELLKQMFASVGEECYIEPPFYSNWGGRHVHLGNKVYANFNLTLVDDTFIYIGDNTMIGPNVTVTTAGHPVNPKLRGEGYQYNFPVTVGKNCWIGAGVTILPGVTIGDNAVIGAGSVVTRDIPANTVAMGIPCKVSREIGERDDRFYFRDHEIEGNIY